ncbi:MAG: hypothetical protein H0V70_25815 [Ktedonobacteraceae bacterium]|nr:hypothetical protein [Ktedonobacteraceae bacterium]
MAKHLISDVEMIVESEESGWFYPKVLIGRPGLIPSVDPQGWMFCKEEGKPTRFKTFGEAEQYLLNREARTKREIQQSRKNC